MSKNILIISTSLRKHSNSEALADQFARGAQKAGHLVEQLSLQGKEMHFCQGCLACQKTLSCVFQDDAAKIACKMGQADVLVFATPIYYYEMSGQMKVLLDRANPLFPTDYHFRDVYFLASAADRDDAAPQRAIAGLEGWIMCFPKARLAGTVFAGGVTNPSDITGAHSLELAFAAGQNI